ncbi:MAG: sensor histidine kinase [Sporomusaceae bacterium]|nr:sensor histidine kinase [Sporomusaceae bacterium]
MKRQSLQKQFKLFTVLLIVVPSLLIMTIYTLEQLTSAKQEKLEMISQRVSSQERMINDWTAERADDVRTLSKLLASRTVDEQHMKHTLDVMQQINKNFDSLSYIDKDGYFKVSTFSKGITYRSAISQPYYQAALAGKDYISDIVIGRNSGLPIINFSSPMYDDDGIFQGVILGSVRLTALEKLLRDNWIGQTGEIFLVNREGVMLTEPRYVNVLIDKGLVESTAVMKFSITKDAFRNIELGGIGTATWIDYLGNNVLGAYRVMPALGWTIIGKIKEEEVLAPIYIQLGIMAVATLLVILLLLPLATLIINQIRRPINWLILQSNLVAAEKYAEVDYNVCSGSMPRELGNLCNTFVNMNRKIEDTVSLLKENKANLKIKMLEIQDINATLEEEISERQTTEKALIVSRDALLLSETQLKHFTSELMETNRELKSFANIIAHDFRTPMVNLKGFSKELSYTLDDLKKIIDSNIPHLSKSDQQKLNELLEDDLPDSLNFINSSVDRLDRMIAALLNLARAGRHEILCTEIDLAELVVTILRSFNHQIEHRGITVEVGTLSKITADYLAIEQILSNLVDNAIKYLDPGRTGTIKIHCTDNNSDYQFTVQDNGRGIAASDLEQIFNIFRRVGNQDVPGDGMGLAYVRTLVRQLNGKVWCQSELGVGTKINFTIPKI